MDFTTLKCSNLENSVLLTKIIKENPQIDSHFMLIAWSQMSIKRPLLKYSMYSIDSKQFHQNRGFEKDSHSCIWPRGVVLQSSHILCNSNDFPSPRFPFAAPYK